MAANRKTKAPTLRTGDCVKIVGDNYGAYKGKIGKLVYVRGDAGEVAFKFNDNEPYVVALHAVKRVRASKACERFSSWSQENEDEEQRDREEEARIDAYLNDRR